MTCVFCGEPLTILYGQHVHDRGAGYKSVRCAMLPPVARPAPAPSKLFAPIEGCVPEFPAVREW